jgi:hypothetical protein
MKDGGGGSEIQGYLGEKENREMSRKICETEE